MVGRVIGVLLALASLGGCTGTGPRSDDVQSFLGINQDIRSVFSTGTDYKSPIAPFLQD